MKERIVILGAGGHARVVAECIDRSKYEIVGFLDKDDEHIGEYLDGIEIIGNDRNPKYWLEKGITGCVNGIGHVGNSTVRNKVYNKFKDVGFHMITMIHKRSIVSPNATLEDGVVVMPGVVINTGAYIKENVIINSNAVVEHDAFIGEGSHIAPGCTISGGVKIGKNVLIGVGSSVIQSKVVGDNTVIGAGTVVNKDVPKEVIAVGNPVRIVRRIKEL